MAVPRGALTRGDQNGVGKEEGGRFGGGWGVLLF